MSPERRLRVLVVDDHDVVLWGLRLALTREPWVARCLSASTPEDALKMTQRYRPHVALVDLCLDKDSGAEVCERLRAEAAVQVLLMSGVGNVSPAVAKAAGASGFVSKNWSAQDISQAVRMVGLGMTVFRHEARQQAGLLSDREREVLTLLASGATNREIAEALYLSPHTVKDHTTALYRKMKARNRADALVRAQRLGLLA